MIVSAFVFLTCVTMASEVQPFAGGEFGMELFAIDGDFEGATAGRDEGERPDAIAEFENPGRQTDGLRRIVSDYADARSGLPVFT